MWQAAGGEEGRPGVRKNTRQESPNPQSGVALRLADVGAGRADRCDPSGVLLGKGESLSGVLPPATLPAPLQGARQGWGIVCYEARIADPRVCRDPLCWAARRSGCPRWQSKTKAQLPNSGLMWSILTLIHTSVDNSTVINCSCPTPGRAGGAVRCHPRPAAGWVKLCGACACRECKPTGALRRCKSFESCKFPRVPKLASSQGLVHYHQGRRYVS